jgi:hypothetical protein
MARKLVCRGCGGTVRDPGLCGFCREERGEQVVNNEPAAANTAGEHRLKTALMRTDEFQKNWGLV